MKKTSTLVIAGALLSGVSGVAIAGPAHSDQSPQLTQAQPQNRSNSDMSSQDRMRVYEQRLRDAKTPEERARIQAEWDRMNQQGQLPPREGTVRSGPGTVVEPNERSAPSLGGETRGD